MKQCVHVIVYDRPGSINSATLRHPNSVVK